MGRTDESWAWLIAGALGSMALAIALIPLRTLVAASNLAFVFLAFTIVVAELGGRGPALVTALVSALSLNFFLTQPYLTLSIDRADDLIAFVALAGCGLIAAAFGRRRERLREAAGRADRELGILTRLIHHTRSRRAAPAALLQELRSEFGLGGLVLRDEQGRVIAAAPESAGALSAPPLALTGDALFAPGDTAVRFGSKGMRLPEGGGRVTLQTARGPVTLDLWEGNEEGFTDDESRTLAIATSILGLGMR
jgi:two-component system sensor histidine kinase KdpD